MGNNPTPPRRFTLQREARELEIVPTVSAGLLQSLADQDPYIQQQKENEAGGQISGEEFEAAVDSHVQHALHQQAHHFHERTRAVMEERESMLEEHLVKKLDQFNSRFSDKTVSDVQCQHLASDLQRCYIANPGRSLDCSPLVKAFVDCSSAAHTDYLTHVNATPPPNN